MMLSLSRYVRIFLARDPVDMRKRVFANYGSVGLRRLSMSPIMAMYIIASLDSVVLS